MQIYFVRQLYLESQKVFRRAKKRRRIWTSLINLRVIFSLGGHNEKRQATQLNDLMLDHRTTTPEQSINILLYKTPSTIHMVSFMWSLQCLLVGRSPSHREGIKQDGMESVRSSDKSPFQLCLVALLLFHCLGAHFEYWILASVLTCTTQVRGMGLELLSCERLPSWVGSSQ